MGADDVCGVRERKGVLGRQERGEQSWVGLFGVQSGGRRVLGGPALEEEAGSIGEQGAGSGGQGSGIGGQGSGGAERV